MSRVPKITSPCPLRWASMPAAGADFCGQCSRRVHNLDGMSQAQRAAFFAACDGSVCVAYTVRRSAALAGVLGLGVAAAALAGASPAAAQDVISVAPASTVVPEITGPTCDPAAKPLGDLESIVVGGIDAARDVQWIDAAEAVRQQPTIGEIAAADWLPTPGTAK